MVILVARAWRVVRRGLGVRTSALVTSCQKAIRLPPFTATPLVELEGTVVG